MCRSDWRTLWATDRKGGAQLPVCALGLLVGTHGGQVETTATLQGGQECWGAEEVAVSHPYPEHQPELMPRGPGDSSAWGPDSHLQRELCRGQPGTSGFLSHISWEAGWLIRAELWPAECSALPAGQLLTDCDLSHAQVEIMTPWTPADFISVLGANVYSREQPERSKSLTCSVHCPAVC